MSPSPAAMTEHVGDFSCSGLRWCGAERGAGGRELRRIRDTGAAAQPLIRVSVRGEVGTERVAALCRCAARGISGLAKQASTITA